MSDFIKDEELLAGLRAVVGHCHRTIRPSEYTNGVCRALAFIDYLANKLETINRKETTK